MKIDYRLLFIKYKKFLVPIGAIVGVFLLTFLVIIPQFSQITEKMREISDKRAEIKMLNNSINTVRTTPDSVLEENYDVATKALPLEKNVEYIFSALSTAASVSNTQLEDFSVEVGGIYGRAAKLPEGLVAAPQINVSAHIGGNSARDVVGFMQVLAETLPVSQISKVDISTGGGSYKLNFFFKPVDAAKIANQFDIQPLSQSELNLLKKLKEWDR